MAFPNNGTLVQVTGNPAIYIVILGQTCWVPDEPTLTNLFTQGAIANIQQITQAQLESLPAGPQLTSGANLIQGQVESPVSPVYLSSWGVRCWIASYPIFESYGFNESNIQTLPVSQLNQIPQCLDITS